VTPVEVKPVRSTTVEVASTGRVRAAVRGARTDVLARNAGWMWLNTLLAAGAGFVFWTLAARRYSGDAVGVAAATAALAPLLAVAGSFGLPETIIRHLGVTANPRRLLRRSAAVTCAAGVTFGVIWWAVARTSTLEMLEGFLWPVLFVVAVATLTMSSVTDAAVVAARRPALLLVQGSVGVVVRLTVLFVAAGDSGVLYAWVLATAAASVASALVVEVGVRFRSTGTVDDTGMRGFAAVNWVSSLVSLAPTALIPTVVAVQAGYAAAAYVAIPLLIYGLLTTVPSVVARSLFAEASRPGADLVRLLRRSAVVAFTVTALGAVALVAGAPVLLRLFGSAYVAESTTMLRLLAVAAVISVVNYLADTTLNIVRARRAYLVVNVFGSSIVLAAAAAGSMYGPVGIGFAWVAGQVGYACVAVTFAVRHARRRC
jgi:O-antigen/teichoic acid export membrane protein